VAPLTDPTRQAAYKDALGNWNFEGYVRFELTETVRNWVKIEMNQPSSW
jgi:hypothetical protein